MDLLNLTEAEFLELARKEHEFPITAGRPPNPATFAPGKFSDIEEVADNLVEIVPRHAKGGSERMILKSAVS